jgi:hypothetical protein
VVASDVKEFSALALESEGSNVNVKNHSTNEKTPHYRQPESTFPSLYVFISSNAISNVLPRECSKIINRWLNTVLEIFS